MKLRLVPEMPFLLAAIMGVHGLVAGFCALAILAAPFGLLRYTIDRQVVSGLVFLKKFGLIVLVFGAITGVIAYGLRKQKLWARDVTFLSWGSVAIALVLWNLWQNPPSSAIASAINMGLYVGFLAWYLYRKQSVRAYYEALEAAENPSPPITRGDAENSV